MTPPPEVALTHPPRRNEPATSRADPSRPGAPATPPRRAGEGAVAPARRDTILGDLVFLVRFAFGRY